MKRYGLIGYPLGHSFSKNYFTKKFHELDLQDHRYDLFELSDIQGFPDLWLNMPELTGLNVTVPHKEAVLPFLHKLDSSAQKVGAVNVIKKVDQKLIGYNSDYYGFKLSLEKFIDTNIAKALILGSGGASKAVQAALTDLNIESHKVSRSKSSGDYSYDELKKDHSLVKDAQLIINTTPLGTHPNTQNLPDIPLQALSSHHMVYDLVYNPEETRLMREAKNRGAKTKNGLEMLHLQADKAWEIWIEPSS